MNDLIRINEATQATPEAPVKVEPVKYILENTDAILQALRNELSNIEDAIFAPKVMDKDNSEPRNECLLGTLHRQRDTAEELLKIATHIREGLW